MVFKDNYMVKFTLKDRLVQQSLKKISILNAKRRDLMFVVVGGMSVQAYATSSNFYRSTNDIDLMLSRNISTSEFREDIGKEISDSLDADGYRTLLGKTRYGYEVRINNGNQDFFIHLGKFSAAYMERNNQWKQREFKNAKEVYLPELDRYPLVVHRIEDVFANKARRLRKLKSYGYVVGPDLQEWDRFTEEDFESLGNINLMAKLNHVMQMREKLIDIGPENFSQNIDALNTYKVAKDLYDISVLSRAVIDGTESLDNLYLRNAIPTITNFSVSNMF